MGRLMPSKMRMPPTEALKNEAVFSCLYRSFNSSTQELVIFPLRWASLYSDQSKFDRAGGQNNLYWLVLFSCFCRHSDPEPKSLAVHQNDRFFVLRRCSACAAILARIRMVGVSKSGVLYKRTEYKLSWQRQVNIPRSFHQLTSHGNTSTNHHSITLRYRADGIHEFHMEERVV